MTTMLPEKGEHHMSRTARLELDGKTYELPVVEGTEDELAVDISTLREPDRLHHPRRRLRQHRLVPERHHLHRRREGHPALPRHPDRGAGREVDLRRDGLPADLRRAADRRASCGPLLAACSTEHRDAPRGHAQATSRASRPTAHPMAILSAMINASRLLPAGVLTDDDAEVLRDRGGPADLARCARIAAASYKKSIGQPIDLPAHDLQVHRELPAHDVLGALPGLRAHARGRRGRST